jgi:hypothetical protein
MNTEVGHPVYQGSQMVRALWFDCALGGEQEARRRLLKEWQPGARAWRVHEGYLLEWRQARRLQCALASGLPLVDEGGVLSSAPLAPGERAGLDPGAAALVVLVLGASVHAYPLDAGSRIDPSRWLDLSNLPVIAPLVMPPGPAPGFVASIPEAAPDVRTLLGDAVPAESPRRAEFLREAQRARARTQGASTGAARAPLRLLGGAALALGAVAGGVAGLLASLPRWLASSTGAGQAGNAASPRPQPAPSPWLDRIVNSVAKLAMLTRVSKLLGWRQAGYLRKMIRQFEDGNLAEALRHAIPLDGRDPVTRAALGTPGRRHSLDIRGPHASAAGIGLDADLQAFLRKTYQRSFEMLDRAGRIDEAVFVLAELLNRGMEAVDYLERKDRVEQAARLAETLELAPAVIIRLWSMAGDLERAIRLARLSDGFGDAVAELERRKHPQAPALRLMWAQEMAARGNLPEAAAIVWPLKDERHRALAWLQAAEQAGGVLGVQGLLYKLALDPQAVETSAAAVQSLLDADSEDAARQRLRAGDCLLRLDTVNAATRRLAGALWRRLQHDRAAGMSGIRNEQLGKLLLLAADPVLTADLPKGAGEAPSSITSLQARASTLSVRFAERGLLPLEDVRRLPDGGYLLALGEAGVALASDEGSELARFPVPAHHLVSAHNGRRALALARREQVVRVSRIDVLARKAEDWFSAPLDFWAQDYDGASWNVVADRRLMALDATAAQQSVLWQVRDLPGKIVGFTQQEDRHAMLLAGDSTLEQWRYALPQRRLLEREESIISDDIWTILPDCDAAQCMQLVLHQDPHDAYAGTLVVPAGVHGKGGSIALRWSGVPARATLRERLLLLRFAAEDGWHCQLIDFNCRVLADIVLPEAVGAQAAMMDGHLLAWDRCGRVVDVEIATGAVRMLTFG